MNAVVISEIVRMAKLGWILEKLGKNFRHYFNTENLREHKTIIDALDPTNTFYVGGSTDDAREQGNGTFSYTIAVSAYAISSYSNSSSSVYVCGGFRFPNVTIPQGSTLSSATFKIYIYSNDDPNFKIYAHAHDNAPNFEDNPHIISTSDRPRTSANVSWVEDDIGVDSFKDSPDIKNVIQEIIDRQGWSSGNAIVLLLIANTDSLKRIGTKYYDESSSYAAKLEITWTSGGGQTYEIYKDAVVKTSAEKSLQTTFNIAKDAAVSSQAVEATETTFNIPKDVIVKSLADLGIETTFSISKDALVQALADVVVEKVTGQLIEIFKDAVVQAQATFSLESIFNINKDAVAEVTATFDMETIFNVVKDAIVETSASPQVIGVYPINLDAVVKASATPSLQQTLGISKDAVVVAISTPLIQSTFNISKDAVVKMLAEVTVIKEGEALKVTKLFLIFGNIAIQLTGD